MADDDLPQAPWETKENLPRAPWEVDQKPATWGETALDVAKQIPSGIALGAQAMAHAGPSLMSAIGPLAERGLEKIGLGNPEEAAQIENRRQAMEHVRPEVANVLPAPETLAGERARNISEFAPGAAAASGRVAPAVIQTLIPGAASQAAGELTQGHEAEPYARLAAGVLGGVGAAKTTAAVANAIHSKAVPTVGETFGAASDLYKYGNKLNVVYPQDKLAALASTMRKDMETFDPEQAPTAFRNIAKLEKLAESDVLGPTKLEKIRQSLNLEAGDRKPLPNGGLTTNATASRRLIGHIDDFLSEPFNSIGPQAREASQVYKHARELWSAASGAKELQDSVTRGEYRVGASGLASTDSTLRQQINKVLSNPSRAARYSPEERDMMKQIVMGDIPRNSARLLGRLTATGIVSAAGGTFLAHMLGLGPMAHMASLGATYGIKKAGEAVTRDRINKLIQSILADSPLGRSRNIPPQTIARSAPFAMQAGIASQIPGQQQRAYGGKVMPDGEKKTHSSVHYMAKSSHKNKSCGLCSMFVPEGPACTLVQSPIASAGYCNRFAGRK